MVCISNASLLNTCLTFCLFSFFSLIINAKGNQSWIFTGRTDAETPILWPPDAKSWLFGKDPDAGKDWKQKKGITKDEMVGWHHWLDGHEFEQTLGGSEGPGSLVCYCPWVAKSQALDSDWTTTKPDCIFWKSFCACSYGHNSFFLTVM